MLILMIIAVILTFHEKFTCKPLKNMIETMNDWQRQNILGAFENYHPLGHRAARNFEDFLLVVDKGLIDAGIGEFNINLRFLIDHLMMSVLQGLSYTAKPSGPPQPGYILEPAPSDMRSYRAYLRPEYMRELDTPR